MDLPNKGSPKRHTRVEFTAPHPLLAEHFRFLLSMVALQDAIIHRDPLHAGMAFIDVVQSRMNIEELEAATSLLEHQHETDWNCPDCEESVPKTFDLCWNCGALHPLLSDDKCIREEEILEPDFAEPIESIH